MTRLTADQLADIESVRQLTVNYARATDLLGSKDESRRAQGRELYHRTFAPEARVRAGDSPVLTGPDAWADYVSKALSGYSTTQHLVGTIDVNLGPGPDQATMSTYLHATHEKTPSGDLWIVLGTYEDECARTAQGWRIASRHLKVTSSEGRNHP